MFTIYGIIDSEDVVRYVGCTAKTVSWRVNSHWITRGTKTSPVSQWLSTLHEKPSYVTLEENVPYEHRVERETAWIIQYGLDNLLNMGLGGTGGARWSDESRAQLIARTRSPEVRQKNRDAQLGKKHTAATRRKISSAHRGRAKSTHQQEAYRQWYAQDVKTLVWCEECGRTCFGRRALGIHKSKAHRMV
jgi:hypothetical protein